MGPDEVHLLVLRELVKEVVKQLSIKFEVWQSGEVQYDWKSRSTILSKDGHKEDLGNYRLVISMP